MNDLQQQWGSASNQSPEGRWLATSDEALTNEHGPNRRDEENDTRENDVRQAYDEARTRAEERESFDRSRPHREELTSKLNADTGRIIEGFVNWHGRMQRDPQTAADEMATSYLQAPVILDRPIASQAEEKAPDHLNAQGRDEWELQQAARNSWRDATNAQREDAEFVATAEHRQLLKQMFPHLTFDQALERTVDFDRRMRADPVGTAARIAVSYGFPVTETQKRGVQEQQYLGEIQQSLHQIRDEGSLPGFGQPEVDDLIAKTLNHMTAQGHRTGDMGADLVRAHDFVVNSLLPYERAQQQQQQQQQETVKRAKAASRSVSGGPSPGYSRARTVGDSVDDAARAAYAQVSARV